MRVYIGQDAINKSSQLKTGEVLYKEKNVVVSAEVKPFITLKLNEGSLLLIWGKPCAILQSDGTIFKMDASSVSQQKLKELAGKMNVREIIKKLEGHFTGVLIKAANDVVIFGDIYNRKDVFYVLKDNSLVASTDLKAVVSAYPPKAYHQEALINIFHVYANYAPKKHTIYKEIARLGVGESLEYKQDKVVLKSFPFEPTTTQDYKDDKLEEYSKLMHSAVEIRSSNQCNWVSLSSGWDSSSILALLVKLHGPSKVRAVISRAKCSTISGVCNQFEIDRAQKIADYFKVPLDILDVDYTKQEFLDYWQEIRDSARANNLYFYGYYDISRLTQHAAKNSPGLPFFNGEVSDGAHNLGFAQFATMLDHPDLGFREYSDKMSSYLFSPSFFSRIIADPSKKDLIYDIFKSRSGSIFDDPAKMDIKQRKTKFAESFFLSNQRIPFISLSNSKLITAKGKQDYELQMRETYLTEFADKVTPDTLYSWFLHMYNSFHWQGSSVKIFSTAAEYYDNSISMPFWDSRVQTFLSAMPESWGRGLDLNPTKYPLKWMLKNKVDYPIHLQAGPHSYLYDIDPNWSVDGDLLYGSIGKSHFKELIKKYPYEAVLQDSHFNLSYLRKLADDYIQDVQVTGQERTDLKNLVNLCQIGWY